MLTGGLLVLGWAALVATFTLIVAAGIVPIDPHAIMAMLAVFVAAAVLEMAASLKVRCVTCKKFIFPAPVLNGGLHRGRDLQGWLIVRNAALAAVGARVICPHCRSAN